MKTLEIIELAKKNLSKIDSVEARNCVRSADIAFYFDEPAARRWAIKSLELSVGVYSPDYMTALKGHEKLKKQGC